MQILVVVANSQLETLAAEVEKGSQLETLAAEVEKGSLRTAFGQGLLGPKFLVKPV